MAKKTKREKVSEESWMNQVVPMVLLLFPQWVIFSITPEIHLFSQNTLCTYFIMKVFSLWRWNHQEVFWDNSTEFPLCIVGMENLLGSCCFNRYNIQILNSLVSMLSNIGEFLKDITLWAWCYQDPAYWNSTSFNIFAWMHIEKIKVMFERFLLLEI